jgi:hypothetical protein
MCEALGSIPAPKKKKQTTKKRNRPQVQAPVLKKKKRRKQSASKVAQACNPSYSGGGDWKDHCWSPAWAKS